MRVKSRRRWSKACLLAGPLRERQGAKAPYSGRATKWSVPTAKHRHSQGHYWGRREESFLSLKRKCPPEQECLHFFSHSSVVLFISYKLLFELSPWLLVQHLWRTAFSRDHSCRLFHPVKNDCVRLLLHTIYHWTSTFLVWGELDFWYRFLIDRESLSKKGGKKDNLSKIGREMWDNIHSLMDFILSSNVLSVCQDSELKWSGAAISQKSFLDSLGPNIHSQSVTNCSKTPQDTWVLSKSLESGRSPNPTYLTPVL